MAPVGSRCQPRGQRTQPPPLASRVWGLGVSRFKGLGLRSLLGPKSGATRLSFRPDAVSAESDLRLKQSQDLFALRIGRIGALQEAHLYVCMHACMYIQMSVRKYVYVHACCSRVGQYNSSQLQHDVVSKRHDKNA